MIVLGGTIGAVMVTTPLKTLIRAAKYLGTVFFEKEEELQQVIEEIIGYATKARKTASSPSSPIWTESPIHFCRKRFH